MRIYFTERFCPLSDKEKETHENLYPKNSLPYKYRKIYPRLRDIDMPVELTTKIAVDHCGILFYNGDLLIVKGTFEETCNQLDEKEAKDDYKEED